MSAAVLLADCTRQAQHDCEHITALAHQPFPTFSPPPSVCAPLLCSYLAMEAAQERADLANSRQD